MTRSPENPPWAVVLGVSSGVGQAIGAAIATDPGYNVFGAHRGHYPAGAGELAASVEAAGRTAHLHVGDAGTAEGVQVTADALLRRAGPRSVALFVHSIANASVGRFVPERGGPRDGSPKVAPDEDRDTALYRVLAPKHFQKTFDSMAHSFVWWAQALVERDLLAPGARLLALTNPIGHSLVANFSLITAAKAALAVYVKHLALELGPRGYRVNLLNFGTVETPAAAYGFGTRWARFKSICEASTPAGRLLEAGEVARFVSLLCGAGAAWFNGAEIDFSGAQAHSILDAALRHDFPPPERTDG